MYIYLILFIKGVLIFLNVICKGVDSFEYFLGFINFFRWRDMYKKGKWLNFKVRMFGFFWFDNSLWLKLLNYISLR